MYLFPYPEDSTILPIQVPYLAKPQQHHLSDDGCTLSIWHEIDMGQPHEELATLLQSRFYFGLMEGILGHLPETELCRRQAQESFDLRLDECLESAWRERVRVLDEMSQEERNATIIEMRNKVEYVNERSKTFDLISAEVGSSLALVTLSVKFLVTYLVKRISVLDWDVPWSIDIRIFAGALPAKVLVARMKDAGWCPQKIRFICSKFAYPVAYFMSSLHRRVPPDMNHKDCSADSCTAYNLRVTNFRPLHRTSSCNCSNLSPPMDEVMAIINSGGIPLVKLHRTERGSIELRVIRRSRYTRYVAFSHVWKDQQFGSDENALPQCQLEYLDHLLCRASDPRRSLPGIFELLLSWVKPIILVFGDPWFLGSAHRLFWLDTLCIPVGEEHVALRQSTINMMDLIYASALQVHILDRELQQIQGGCERIVAAMRLVVEVPARRRQLTILAHLLSCGWMGRVWPLQEASLAQNCIVQLEDSTINAHTLLQDMSPRLHRYAAGVSAFFRDGTGLISTHPAKTYLKNVLRDAFTHPDGRRRGEWYESMKRFASLPIKLFNFSLLFAYSMAPRSSLYGSPILAAPCDLRRDRDAARYSMESLYIVDMCESILSLMKPLPFGITLPSGIETQTELRQFIDIWNSILTRSTTKAEDLERILVNLSGFVPEYGAQSKDNSEITRTLLGSLKEIPVDLLFLNVPKYKGGNDHPDRWIPIAPSGAPLPRECSTVMKPSKEGFLIPEFKELSVFILEPGATRVNRFRLRKSAVVPRLDIEGSPAEESVWVECFPPANDEMHERAIQKLGIIMSSTTEVYPGESLDGHLIRGARFIVTVEGKKTFLRYDCALHATNAFREPTVGTTEQHTATGKGGVQSERHEGAIARYPTFHARELNEDCELYLEHGKFYYDILT